MLSALVSGALRVLARKDGYTIAHSRRVSCYAVQIARELGLGPNVMRYVEVAGQLHDIGKVGVPTDLLRRAGPLSASEYRMVLRHTLIGEAILSPALPPGHPVLGAVRSHHEQWDGSGFPDGLRGSAIPFVARMVAVADAFDAMTSTRTYRPALSVSAALCELERTAGAQFDPACVAALVRSEPSWAVLPLTPWYRPPRQPRAHATRTFVDRPRGSVLSRAN